METQKTQGGQKEPSKFPAFTGQEEPAAAALNPNPEKRFSRVILPPLLPGHSLLILTGFIPLA